MWKEQAEALFFVDHLKVSDIAKIIGRSRKSVSQYLNSLEAYELEMSIRKRASGEARKEYQKEWDRQNRPRPCEQITGDSLRLEHETAARILSAEMRY